MAVRGEMEIAERDKGKKELGGGNGRILGLASRWTRRTNIGMGGEGGWASLPARIGRGEGREVCVVAGRNKMIRGWSRISAAWRGELA